MYSPCPLLKKKQGEVEKDPETEFYTKKLRGFHCFIFNTALIKNIKHFLICREIQMGSGAKSYITKGFRIYEEMRKYLTIYGEAVSHI
jgi:hypothetical protein